MAFRPLLPTTVRWRPMEGDGLEHLTIAHIDTATGAAIRACGTIIGGRGDSPCDLPVDADGLVIDYPIYFKRVDV